MEHHVLLNHDNHITDVNFCNNYLADLCPESENPQTLKIASYTGGLTEDQHIDRPGSDEASRLEVKSSSDENSSSLSV